IVLAADARGRLQVDLFILVLADVADPEVAAFTIETETPRIAKSVRPDLVPHEAQPKERVRRGNRVRQTVIDVDAQNLAQKLRQILGVVARIARKASVARADVEVAVRAELQLAAVVVRGGGMGNAQ